MIDFASLSVQPDRPGTGITCSPTFNQNTTDLAESRMSFVSRMASDEEGQKQRRTESTESMEIGTDDNEMNAGATAEEDGATTEEDGATAEEDGATAEEDGATGKDDAAAKGAKRKSATKKGAKKTKEAGDGLFKLVVDMLAFILTIDSTKHSEFTARFTAIKSRHHSSPPVSTLSFMREKLTHNSIQVEFSPNMLMKHTKEAIIDYLVYLHNMLKTNNKRSLFICNNLGIYFNKLYDIVGKDKWMETLLDLNGYFSNTDVYFYRQFADFIKIYPKFLNVNLSIYQFMKKFNHLIEEMKSATDSEKNFWKDSSTPFIDLTEDEKADDEPKEKKSKIPKRKTKK